jgi:L,D-transpeptidase ErfK/SrfK
MLVGSEGAYTVRPGDSFARIGARFGVDAGTLAHENDLTTSARVRVGQVLRVDTRHIVPRFLEDGILINLPQRMLFSFVQAKLLRHYPVGLGRPDWPTPTGAFEVVRMAANPVWHVPKSIQAEMRRRGKRVKTQVPPGPDNPLGKYMIGLSLPCYGIHGTTAPSSIYGFHTHGCIRLHPDDIEDLFRQLSLGTSGRIIYEPVLLAESDGGRIYLEVHRDMYKQGVDMGQTVQRLAAARGISARVDWQRVQQVIRTQEGIAREVTLQPSVQSGRGESMMPWGAHGLSKAE